ncbi:uncharacterized protein LOC128883724 isoform X2 [Hylaeus volcanicus]|uniref:uncharacterized protein LOC128883724 isoform X2 n=1 Tax=Hylaeus volcanicus TaxID=313075 RepID=UPI0023B7B41E|nr:uncharacterized protein LOC128883724 isoform X2 [Hylaeus volcanicus]
MSCSPDILSEDFSHKTSHTVDSTAPILFQQKGESFKKNCMTGMNDKKVYVEGNVCDSPSKPHMIDSLSKEENPCGSLCSENQGCAFHSNTTFDKDSDSRCFDKRVEGNFFSCQIRNIPNVPVKKMLLDIGRDLNKSEDEMAPFIELLVCHQWIENLSHLKLMTISDWESLKLPYQLFKAIQEKLEEPYTAQVSNDSTQCSESENTPFDQQQNNTQSCTQQDLSKPHSVPVPSSDLVEFVTAVCKANTIPNHQKDQALHCLCEKQWFNSIDDIKSLTTDEWDSLNVPLNVSKALQNALADTSEASLNSLHLREIIFTAGLALNRSPSDLVHVFEVLTTYDLNAIESFSKEDWLQMKLPLRLYDEILVQIQQWKGRHNNEQITFPAKNLQKTEETLTKKLHYKNFDPSYIVTSLKDFQEKCVTVEDVLIQAGKLVGKTEEEISLVIQKVVKDNWITSLHNLSNMQYSDWLNVGIPKRLADALTTVLCNPSLLKLTLVQFSDEGPNLYFENIFASIWQMEAEIPIQPLQDVSNVYFKNLLTKYKSVRTFVHSLGYEELRSVFALFLVSIARFTQAHAILTKLACILRNRSKI